MGYVEIKFCDKINYLSDIKKNDDKMKAMFKQTSNLGHYLYCTLWFQITLENIQNLYFFY